MAPLDFLVLWTVQYGIEPLVCIHLLSLVVVGIVGSQIIGYKM